MAEAVHGKESQSNPEMERLLAENALLKAANQLLTNLVDDYDKALTDMTALQRESGGKLHEAAEIIGGILTGRLDRPREGG